LRRAIDHAQHRPRALSALAAVLLHHPGGVLTMRTRRSAIAAGLLALAAACNFDITNTNQPTLDDLVANPTRAKLSAAATGLFAGARGGIQALIWRLGSMGREGVNLSGNNQPDFVEPYFGPVGAGGSFGGTLWLDRYVHIRSVNIFLQALASNATAALPAPDRLSAAEAAGARGVANTLKALTFLYIIQTRGSLGAPVDVDRPVDADPAPFVTEDSVYGYILGLLNGANADLAAGGSSFFTGFQVPPGLAAFATPATFTKFNRARPAARPARQHPDSGRAQVHALLHERTGGPGSSDPAHSERGADPAPLRGQLVRRQQGAGDPRSDPGSSELRQAASDDGHGREL